MTLGSVQRTILWGKVLHQSLEESITANFLNAKRIQDSFRQRLTQRKVVFKCRAIFNGRFMIFTWLFFSRDIILPLKCGNELNGVRDDNRCQLRVSFRPILHRLCHLTCKMRVKN